MCKTAAVNLRVPVQFIPLLAAALTAAALMTPGGERGVEEPARFEAAFPLREGVRRVPAAGSLPVQPYAMSQSVVAPRLQPDVLLPGTDTDRPYGAGRRGFELADATAAPVQPSPARAVRGRNQKPLLPELAQDDAMGLPGADDASGWGWLEDDIRAMDKAAAQRAAELGKRQDDDEPFGGRFLGSQTPASMRMDAAYPPGPDEAQGLERSDLLPGAPAADVDSRQNLFRDTRADGPADQGALFDSGSGSAFSIE